jgi:hypothetical protein
MKETYDRTEQHEKACVMGWPTWVKISLGIDEELYFMSWSLYQHICKTVQTLRETVHYIWLEHIASIVQTQTMTTWDIQQAVLNEEISLIWICDSDGTDYEEYSFLASKAT